MAVAVIQGGEWGGVRMATAKRATDPMTSHPLTGCPPRVATRRHDCHSQSNDHTWNHLADDERALTPQARHAAQHTVEAPPEIYFWIRVSAASLFAWWWRIVSRICGGRSAEEFRHIVVRKVVRRLPLLLRGSQIPNAGTRGAANHTADFWWRRWRHIPRDAATRRLDERPLGFLSSRSRRFRRVVNHSSGWSTNLVIGQRESGDSTTTNLHGIHESGDWSSACLGRVTNHQIRASTCPTNQKIGLSNLVTGEKPKDCMANDSGHWLANHVIRQPDT